MPSLRYVLARSEHPVPRVIRRVVRGARTLSVPAPKPLVLPLVRLWQLLQTLYYLLKRKLIAEPSLKAQCARYGRRLRCGNFVHYIVGSGDIVLGDDVILDGKADIFFGAVLPERPRLEIGSRTYVNHRAMFGVASRVTIGDDVYVAGNVRFMDSPGHPLDPARRLAKLPPDVAQVKPITVGNNVWIGTDVILLPGATIGEGSVIAAGAIVTGEIPPYTLAGGMPARPIRTLDRPPGVADPSESSVTGPLVGAAASAR